METTLYRITFSDGRMFKVFCANKKQKGRAYATAHAVTKHDPQAKIETLENGIHDIGQWEKIVATLK